MRQALLLIFLVGCLSGPTTAPVPQEPGISDGALSQTGRWLAPFDGQVPAVNLVQLADGRILYWSGVEARPTQDPLDQVFITTSPYEGESRILEWTEDGPVITEPYNNLGDGDDLFCSGQTMLPDGRILVAGGTNWYEHQQGQTFFLEGTEHVRIFDPEIDTWYRMDDMVLNRWYPTVFTAPDGNAVAASGIGSLTDQEEHWANWEVYEDDWRLLAGTDGHLLPLYPHLHVVPGGPLAGHAMYTASATLWGPFGEHRQQAEWSFFKSYDLAGDTWHEHGPSQFGARNYATSTMLIADPADGYATTMLTTGGTLQQTLPATPLVEIIDATDPPTSRRGPDMHHGRWNHQAVLLPTNEVLIVGGGTYDNVVVHGQDNIPIMPAESWDPVTETWTLLPAMTVPRMYHSTAILMPDARVLVGGHVPLPDDIDQQIVETRLEIYEPGYLFRGERPQILEAPATVGHGESFTVRFQHTSPIVDAVLMRPGATTHAHDSNARGIRLDIIAQANGTISLQAPPDAIVSPPGPHMLFLLGEHSDGPVPSVASWLDLRTEIVA